MGGEMLDSALCAAQRGAIGVLTAIGLPPARLPAGRIRDLNSIGMSNGQGLFIRRFAPTIAASLLQATG
jgi:hypothetical protein